APGRLPYFHRSTSWPDGQLSTRLTGHVYLWLRPAAAVCALLAAVACGPAKTRTPGPSTAADTPSSGGPLVVSIQSEPQSFNWFVKHDGSLELLTYLMHAKLVRINHVTGELEPWLAEAWTRSDDGLLYTLKLRANVAFSDGHPFSADDVAF